MLLVSRYILDGDNVSELPVNLKQRSINRLKLFTSYKESLSKCVSNQTLEFTRVIIHIFIGCMLFCLLHRLSIAQTVDIPAPGLRAAVELALGKEAGGDITQADMANLKVLQASRCRFLKRSGVPQWIPLPQRCPDDRFETDIQDLTGLEFAINLEELHLAHNQISDITPLGALTKLIVLDLHNNFRISDASPLSALTNLTHLSLWGNLVSDAFPLSALTNLIYLSLENNLVSDVSPLSALTNLRGLDLETNLISDLSALKVLTGLIFLDFDRNRVSDVSALKGMTKLTQLDISDNQISDLSPLSSLTELTQLDIDDNQVIDVSPLKDMTKMLWMDIDGNQIRDVSALQNMTNLTRANLDDNQISDVSPLKDLTKLVKLDLDHNNISDISPLQNMIGLTWLDIDDNEISDVSALQNMTRLTLLDLGDNEISDISALENMIRLTELDLNDNQISDISSLKNMTRLKVLDLNGNNILDASPLQDMIRLTELDLHDNQISDVSPLKNMTKLKVLDLRDNQISDFSPIAGLIDNLMEYYNSSQTLPTYEPEDANQDGVVNIKDLVLVASNFHDPDLTALARMNIYPDVNRDGVVNLIDLLLIAAEMGSIGTAPSLSKNSVETSNFTAENLAHWIRLAKQLDTHDPQMQKGITVLEQLLAALSVAEMLPQETALLANYPNPFNPETWIPYQLAIPSVVNISIHSADGQLVRILKLGHLSAGIYHSKSRAAYWDGRNESGESVASGVYFYTLTAGDFTATGKMLIRK